MKRLLETSAMLALAISGAGGASAAGIVQPAAPPAPAATRDSPEADDDRPQDILVTARRREERIADVPAAVDVIGQQAIADRGGLVTLQDLAVAVPSVNFAATSTPTTAEISMRGSGTARSTNAEGGVGLYRNGTYVGGGRRGGRTFTRMDFFDLDRIEVLRGVQGALYGRNAVGGALNLINIQPQFDTGGWARIGFGQWGKAEAQGALNFAFSDRLAIRVGVDFMNQSEGAFYNPFKKDHFDDQNAKGVRGQMRYRAGIVDINLLAEASEAKLPPLVFAVQIPKGTTGFPNGVFQDPYNVGWNGNSVANQRQRSGILSIKVDLPFALLNANGSLRRRASDHGFDADGLDPIQLAALRAGGGALNTDVNQEALQLDRTRNRTATISMSDKGAAPLKWLVGYEHVTILSNARFSTTRTPTTPNPSPGNIQLASLDTTANAVFGSLGYEVAPGLTIGGELRHTREHKTIISDRVDLATRVSQGARFRVNAEDRDSNTSWNLTGSYRLAPIDGLVYLRVGTGYRAGGFNDDLGDPRAPNPVIAAFGPETAKSYEFGFKGRIIPQLNVNVALYQTDTEDNLIQDTNGCALTVPACPVAATIFLRNGGDNRVRGVETQVDGAFSLGPARLRLNGSIGYIDAVIRTGPDAGRLVPQVPKWLYTLGANLSAPVGNQWRAFSNIQYNSRNGGVQEIVQTPALVDFYNIDGRIGLRRGGLEIAAFLNNLTDNRYTIFSTATLVRVNMPRSWGVQITNRFR